MERNRSLDGLKFILIALVVIGHFIEPSRYSDQVSCYLYSLIYSFHMPLFIFLNGYFYKHRPIKEEISKCVPLFEVCLISHVIFAYLSNVELSIRGVVNFAYTPSWYLLSLIFWRMLSSIFLKRWSAKDLLFTSVLIEVITFIAIPRYGGIFSLMRTFQFLPFFAWGYLAKGKLNELYTHKKQISILGVLSFAYILFSSCRLQHQCFYQRASLLELSQYTEHSLLWLFVFRYSIIICSLFICVFLLLVTFNNNYIIKMAKYGMGTLYIYFGQTLLYPIVLRCCSTLPISIAVSIPVIIVLTHLSMKPISKWMMNPICTLVSKHKDKKSAV